MQLLVAHSERVMEKQCRSVGLAKCHDRRVSIHHEE
jgi:hypothetical protein